MVKWKKGHSNSRNDPYMACSMLSQTNGMGLFLDDLIWVLQWSENTLDISGAVWTSSENILWQWNSIGLVHHVLLNNISILITMFAPGSLTGCWNDSPAIFKKTLIILQHNIRMYFFLFWNEWRFHKACILVGCDICVKYFWVERNTAVITKPPHFAPPTPQKPLYHYQNPQKIFDNKIIIQTLSFKIWQFLFPLCRALPVSSLFCHKMSPIARRWNQKA